MPTYRLHSIVQKIRKFIRMTLLFIICEMHAVQLPCRHLSSENRWSTKVRLFRNIEILALI